MKRLLLIVILLAAAFSIYWFKFGTKEVAEEPKQQPIKTNQHSAAFNAGLDGLMSNYFAVKDAFVEADSVKAKELVKTFVTSLDSLKLDELKKDSSAVYQTITMQLGDVKANAESILSQNNITEMRKDFQGVSESIYPLLKSIHYEGKTLYWQNCPMAFGEDKGANWLSNTDEIVNPYLGKKHPDYKATMLHCGEVKDSIKAQ